jgi:hypothetical protein
LSFAFSYLDTIMLAILDRGVHWLYYLCLVQLFCARFQRWGHFHLNGCNTSGRESGMSTLVYFLDIP